MISTLYCNHARQGVIKEQPSTATTRVSNDDLENDDLENDDLENDDLENDDLENDDLENDDLENDDLENEDGNRVARRIKRQSRGYRRREIRGR